MNVVPISFPSYTLLKKFTHVQSDCFVDSSISLNMVQLMTLEGPVSILNHLLHLTLHSAPNGVKV